ncbi:MAG: Asp23/Gls24 family envelope stress response protein [Coriobacteriales bacterium]|nr:Asp23/Gls24 family envelope stress response protein [Actinomycetes bacterium]
MSEEIQLEGIGVAPGVLETIATLAAEQVPGVAAVQSKGMSGLVGRAPSRGVAVTISDEGALNVQVHIAARYGTPLRSIATDVQKSIADALESQTGQRAASIDVFVDSIVFPEE